MTKELALKNDLALMGPMGSLEAYIGIVNQSPVLSREEERELAYRFQNENDLDAARKLIPVSYTHLTLPTSDLV